MATLVSVESLEEGHPQEELSELMHYKDNFNRLCRLCLSEERLVSLYSDVQGRNVFYVPHFVKFALDLLAVDINKHDALPNFLCERCEHNLYIITNFKQKCDESLAILQCVRNSITNQEHLGNAYSETVKKERQVHRKRKRNLNSTRIICEEKLRKVMEIVVAKSDVKLSGNCATEKEPEVVQRNRTPTRHVKSLEQLVDKNDHLEHKHPVGTGTQEEHLLDETLYNPNKEQHRRDEQCDAGQKIEPLDPIKSSTLEKAIELLEEEEQFVELLEETSGLEKDSGAHDENVLDEELYNLQQEQNREDKGRDVDQKIKQEDPLESSHKNEKQFLELLRVTNGLEKDNAKRKSQARRQSPRKEEAKRGKSTNKEKIVCPICGAMVNNIKSHLVIHNDVRPHKCDQCPKRFTSRNKLQSHTNSVHLRKRDFKCDICGKAFLEKNNLKGHMRIHNGERKYTCDLCPKTFLFAGTLRYHKLTHTQEKKHECQICGKMFLMRTTLNKHLNVHTGERPHKCDLCEKRFRTSTHKVVHMRTHTGEKPLVCRFCGMSFAHHKARSVHMKSKHHGELVAKGLIDDNGHLKF